MEHGGCLVVVRPSRGLLSRALSAEGLGDPPLRWGQGMNLADKRTIPRGGQSSGRTYPCTWVGGKGRHGPFAGHYLSRTIPVPTTPDRGGSPAVPSRAAGLFPRDCCSAQLLVGGWGREKSCSADGRPCRATPVTTLTVVEEPTRLLLGASRQLLLGASQRAEGRGISAASTLSPNPCSAHGGRVGRRTHVGG